MKTAIWATLLHKISTDNHPQHDDCPTGENARGKGRNLLTLWLPIRTNHQCHGHKNWSKKSRTMDLDEKRIQKAERSLSEGAKQARIDLKTIQKAKQEQEIDEESQLYGAGIHRRLEIYKNII
ncbi:hypothetical protein G5I_08747 [Acromyrmex echinatior]|uniref:Uncharacterized protein n=1 Tax=Acromyrmex echinatior TaxID=103372 RepID=F4WSC5_ACREC|nr:hypothetical protein G5I_08747 [Acromyrmex echinatior]